jgi:hypothetical protein
MLGQIAYPKVDISVQKTKRALLAGWRSADRQMEK